MTVTHTWLEYPETGGKAEFPVQAVEMWRARGWVDCDPPPEANLANAHLWDLADDGGVASSEAPEEEASSEDVAEAGEQGSDATESVTRSSRRTRGSAPEE